MKILYLSLDPPLDAARVATGNQVRVQGIREALEAAGHDVLLATPSRAAELPAGTGDHHRHYRTREELSALLRQHGSQAVLAGYWSLLAHLGEDAPPVVLDCIAPRLLELLYQDPEQLAGHAAELIGLLPRADHFLVGNQRQADLLLGLLLQAGFDCRADTPISLVPIAARGSLAARERRPGPPRIVNAGVRWPWRQGEAYARVLREAASAGAIGFIELGGDYPGAGNAEGDEAPASTLVPYRDLLATLQDCDAGVELGEPNTERAFSHSFRVVEYLGCGLPVLVNPWIPLAQTIREFDAGWVVASPEELRALLDEWRGDPAAVAAKRAGVQALVAQRLNCALACRPLLEWLAAPRRAPRFGPRPGPLATAGETPGLRDFVETPTPKPSALKVLLGTLLKALFFPRRPDATPDVLVMTRADLFPTDHGAAVKIVRTAEALSRQGRDVWLATDERAQYRRFHRGEMSVHRFPLWVRALCLPRFAAFARLLLKGYPASNSFLYLPVTDASYIVRALWLAGRKPVGAYLAEFPAYVRPLRFARSLFGGALVLVQHNVEYERIRSQVPGLSEKNFRSLKSLELAMCQLADSVITVSENDRERLVQDGVAGGKIHTIPHGVDLRAFREATPVDLHEAFDLPRGDRVLVYHGTYSYPPNLQAMQVMAKEILPRLEAAGRRVSVLAIGSMPPDFPLHEKIRFTGSITELAPVLPAADLAVVPLLDGGGTRMKILDYFAAGVPVVSTAKGIEGIPVRHGREAVIVDGIEDMCAEIGRLLDDPAAARVLADNAAGFVEDLSWDAIARRYLPLMQ